MNDFIIHSCMHPCTYPAMTGSCMPICIERFRKMHGIYTESGESMKERLTIEDVIAHCERRMDRAESFFTKERLEEMPIEGSAAKEYWEHRQVREWLLELQELRKTGAVTGKWILTAHKTDEYAKYVVKARCSECKTEEFEIWAGYFLDVPVHIALLTAMQNAKKKVLPRFCQHCGSRNEVE